eukprot:TRINITY_DN813_c0_g1_i2.p1 TRINITY_DN813_c0_g1~~TRINITY_DN813_c0_g1_i2.p1  ORF type:complete len:174 (+),score=40.31 TRINITY_DN813_c0_g1_i2:34-555(+)
MEVDDISLSYEFFNELNGKKPNLVAPLYLREDLPDRETDEQIDFSLFESLGLGIHDQFSLKLVLQDQLGAQKWSVQDFDRIEKEIPDIVKEMDLIFKIYKLANSQKSVVERNFPLTSSNLAQYTMEDFSKKRKVDCNNSPHTAINSFETPIPEDMHQGHIDSEVLDFLYGHDY